MRGRFRPPMFVIAAALVGLMALLATLQYRWLGRISEAERESRRSTLNARAAAFASDFDKELTLAYTLFQIEPLLDAPITDESLASRFAVRHERWQAASRFPRLIADYFVATREDDDTARLRRFDPATKIIEPAEWPTELGELRRQMVAADEPLSPDRPRVEANGTFFVRVMAGPLWEEVPALVVPMPMVLLSGPERHLAVGFKTFLSHTVLVLDRQLMTREMLPSLARQHLRGMGDGVEYELAVVSTAGRGVVYRSASTFEPKPDAKVDAVADLFQVRPQEFAQMVADVKRFTLSVPSSPGEHAITAVARPPSKDAPGRESHQARRFIFSDGGALPMRVDQATAGRGRALVTSVTGAIARPAAGQPKWRLLVKHPSGSLEAAVDMTRRRNLILSSSILAVLAASMALLVLSARRSQEVARQQMEFVAAVSHELRTPLAVIRSAGDNLADGVVGDAAHIRKYGELVRSEGRRLSEMVEQILEFAGIQSGQRRFEPGPVNVPVLLHEVLSASAALIEGAGIRVDMDLPPDLPPVLGAEPALRRAFQNLVGNAIKYGGEGRWLGLRARQAGGQIHVTVADRGLGIAPSEHGRIFEPFYRTADVIAAQIQGAGLGLSLVQRIVEAHGGRVVVKSAPGAGSEFTVQLPAAGPEPAPGAEPRGSEAPRYT